eukprot:3178463-Pyramimonas_sp.AAC.1
MVREHGGVGRDLCFRAPTHKASSRGFASWSARAIARLTQGRRKQWGGRNSSELRCPEAPGGAIRPSCVDK